MFVFQEEDDLQNSLQDIKTSRIKVIEMKIPKSVVGVVIGRAGSNIKDIQEKTDTRIHFKDKGKFQSFAHQKIY